jgi:tetratricopeptide (TPR) repeat protein
MYLRGNKWTMTRRPQRRSSPWRILLLLGMVGAALYINRVVVPVTPAIGVPSPTPTQSAESYINRAQELYAAGKLTQAISAYQEAITVDPTNPSNYVELARLQVYTGEYDQAIENSQNGLLKNPDNPLAHAVMGWAYGFQEKYGEAELEIKKALSIDPNNALAHAYYAEILINQNDYNLFDKAIAESQTARDLDPSLLETHRARGIVLLNTQNVEQAVEEFQTALTINKNIADLHLNLGLAYRLLQKFDLAQEALLAAYALNPTDTVALTELSRAFFADGRYAQAAQYAEEAVKVEPDDPRLHGNLGIMYYKAEDYDKAIGSLGTAIRGGTTSDGAVIEGLPLEYGRVEEFYWYYGFALARRSRCSEAIPVFQALLAGVPEDEIAVYNANEGLTMCAEQMGTPRPTETPEGTPEGTPEATATP